MRRNILSSPKAAAQKASSGGPLRSQNLRSQIVLLLLTVAFLGLIGRAFYLQVVKQNFLEERGQVRYARTLTEPSVRGRILDRNDRILASSIPARAVWAIPELLARTPNKDRAQLAQLLEMSETELNNLIKKNENFVYLKHQVDPIVAQKIAQLDIDGVDFKKEFRRVYPEANASASLVGLTNIDDKGIEGVEKLMESYLAGTTGIRRVIKDLKGRVVEDIAELKTQKNGSDIRLTIDSQLQFQLYNQLKEAVTKHAASSGSGVLVDTANGDILALANYPSFDPNERKDFKNVRPNMRNRVFTDYYEPGSTMKPISVAAALDGAYLTPETVFNTAPGRITVDGRTIGDTHNYGVLNVAQIIEKSSNVGMAKIVLPIPSQVMHKVYSAAGFGRIPNIPYPGAIGGRLRQPESWRPIEKTTISYGHGISVSLAQIVQAYTIFASDGVLIPLHLFRDTASAKDSIAPVRVIKPSTARAVRSMLELATSKDGTGFSARIDGYRIAGKTGTTRKLENGSYVSRYIASFIGFAPASNPRFLMAVMVDNPTQNGYYGGGVAAPVFANTMQYALHNYNVQPDMPRNNFTNNQDSRSGKKPDFAKADFAKPVPEDSL